MMIDRRRHYSMRQMTIALPLLVLSGCQILEDLDSEPQPIPETPPLFDGGVPPAREGGEEPATVAPCLDCLRIDPDQPWPPDSVGNIQWTLFFTYSDDLPCIERAAPWLDRLDAPGFRMVPIPRAMLRLDMLNGTAQWMPVGPLFFGGGQWRIDIQQVDLAELGLTDLDEVQSVALAGACGVDDGHCEGDEVDGEPTVCGLGDCRANGFIVCEGEDFVDTCEAGEPRTEQPDGADNDCNGIPDDCYDGLEGTQGTGPCRPGTLRLDAETGDIFCDGQRMPETEQSNSEDDDDCDGDVDDRDIACGDCRPPEFSTPLDELGATERFIVRLRRPLDVPADPAERRADVTRVQGRVIGEISDPPGGAPERFEVLRRYRMVYGFVAEVDRATASLMLDHEDVAGLIRDLRLEPALAEAHAVTGIGDVHGGDILGAGVRIALLDTGVAVADPALGACVAAGEPDCPVVDAYDAFDGQEPPPNIEGHGTSMARLAIGRSPEAAGRGVAPEADLVDVRIATEAGGWMSDLVAGLDWLLEREDPSVRVAAIGLGSTQTLRPDSCESVGQLVGDTVQELAAQGILTVAPSGNSGALRTVSMPACLGAVLAVGATYDANSQEAAIYEGVCLDPTPMLDQMTCFTAGQQARAPFLGLLAPGAGITRGNDPVPPGTSISATLVSGAAALLMSVMPDESPEEIVRRLKANAVQVDGANVRRLDLRGALP